MLILVLAAQLTAGVLLAFSARRAVLLAAAVVPGSAPEPETLSPAWPKIEVLVPCRNEAKSLPGLFPALEASDYAREALRVTIVDDASTDDTSAVAQAWAANRPWVRVLALTGNVGKAQALNWRWLAAYTLILNPSWWWYLTPTTGRSRPRCERWRGHLASRMSPGSAGKCVW